MSRIFDHIAPVYSVFDRFIPRPDLESSTSNSEKILDVGGGTGTILQKISSSDTQVYLLDRSRPMLKHSDRSLHRVQGDASRIPFSDSSFDTILCIDALHHFGDKHRALKELVRVTEPGGSVVIIDLEPKSPLTMIICMVERLLGEPSYFLAPGSLVRFFSEHGWTSEIDGSDFHQFILTAKKPDSG